MNKEAIFTSTGSKLIHHPEVVFKLQKNRAMPISIQIAPTSKCQLSCCFCSNRKRAKQEDLDPRKLITFLDDMCFLGAKTVEWTGGGDPSLYYAINEMINVASGFNFEQGFITNGLGFDKLHDVSLESLKWIRISMNCLDYVDEIEIPELPKHVTLGFSYVFNEKSTIDIFRRINKHIEKFNPKYVRIVPNCQTTEEQQKNNNSKYSVWVEELGEPYFYQAKIFEKPELCYWGYLKPFLLHDGWIYRCSSIVLNDDAEKSFHEKYRWCMMEDLRLQYAKEIIPYIPNCSHCVFTKQNNGIHEIINPSEMKNFI